ncbi:hypothetical protein Tco_1309580, partial [Tanacetum coccineum]
MESFVNNAHVSLVGKVLITVIIALRKFRLSLIRNHAKIKPLMSPYKARKVCNNNVFLAHAKDVVVMITMEFVFPTTLQVLQTTLHNHNAYHTLVNDEEKRLAEEQAARDRSWKIPVCYDDDEDNIIAITPVLPIEEPDNSLSMEDEHLDTIPVTESDEVIKSSVEDLIPIPSESEGIPDKMCDVPLCKNTTPLNEHSEIVVNSDDDNSSSDDDYPY